MYMAGHRSCGVLDMLTYLGWVVLSFATAATAIAADGEKKAFPLPDNSKLELIIPLGWKDELREKTIALSPREGAPFQVVLAPVARQRPGASADTAVLTAVMTEQSGSQPSAPHVSPISQVWVLGGGQWKVRQARFVSEARLNQVFR